VKDNTYKKNLLIAASYRKALGYFCPAIIIFFLLAIGLFVL